MSNAFKVISDAGLAHPYDSVVGMGVYKGDQVEWVEQAIDSVLCQSHKNFLFIIVIDGDISLSLKALLNKVCLHNPNLLLVKSEHNVGLSQCMNFAIEWALSNVPSAQFFFRMDSDDKAMPDRFAKQVEFFKDNQNVSILGTSLVEINENGRKVGKRKLPVSHKDIVRILPKRCAINHPTVAIRMSVFKAGHRYRGYLKNTQDYFFWAELAAAGFTFANLSEQLLQFRRVNDFYKRRGLSKSINEFKARFYTMKVLKKYSLGNIVYAFAVLFLRLMPAKVVKLAYKIDRYFLNKWVKHE